MGTGGFLAGILANSRENSIALKTPRKKDAKIRNFRNARITGWAKEKFDARTRDVKTERERQIRTKNTLRHPFMNGLLPYRLHLTILFSRDRIVFDPFISSITKE